LAAGCALEAEGLVAGYRRGEPVLRGASLRVEPGEVVALLGPNGSGKTTLLRVLAGLLKPWRGEVRVCGYKPWSGEARRRVSYLPGVPGEDENVKALDVVVAGRYGVSGGPTWSGRDWEAAWRALRRLGAEGLAGRRLRELSAGERRLVAIASALAREAPILLLDEPFENLDLANRRRVAEALREEAARGASVLLTLHEPTLAPVADRLYVLLEGRLESPRGPGELASLLQEAYRVPVDLVEAGGRVVALPRIW